MEVNHPKQQSFKIFSLILILLDYVLTHSPNSINRGYWEKPSCDMVSIQKDLGRVCAVYKRSAEDYYVRPIVEQEGPERTGFNPPTATDPSIQKKLLGYYYRAPLQQQQQQSPNYIQPQLGYFFNAPFDFRTPTPPNIFPGGIFYPPPPEDYRFYQAPLPYLPAIPNQYLFYEYDGMGYAPRGPGNGGFDDPFKRWRRQAVLRKLAVKCCSSTGCTPLDFIIVDEEYKICDK